MLGYRDLEEIIKELEEELWILKAEVRELETQNEYLLYRLKRLEE